MPHNTGKIILAYKSKHYFKRENQVNLLMITNSKEQTKLKKHKRVCNDYDYCYV